MSIQEAVKFEMEGPQPLVRELPEGVAYPVEALGPLAASVKAVQADTQAPMAIPAASALAVASLAVQGFGNVETLGGPRPLSLYVLTVAESGARKSACDAPFMEALREHERAQALEAREALRSWENAHALWKGEREKILNEAKRGKGMKRTEAQADLDALREPERPPATDRTVTEPTYEGLTRLFADGPPSLGLFSDEGGQFLGGYAMSKDNRQKTLAALNDLWQGNPIQRTRAGDGHATLYGRRLAVHLMVQPRVAHDFMADPLAAETGFLPRFLMCQPPSTQGTRFISGAMEPKSGAGGFSQRLRAVLSEPLPMDQETRELRPNSLGLTKGAQDALVRFYNEVERELGRGGAYAHIQGTASKIAEQAARIAGVLELWADLHTPQVSAETMGNAITLARFYLSEAARLANAASLSVEIERAETLRRWLLEKWEHPEILPSEVVQYGPNSLREIPKAKAALDILAQHGWLVPLEEGAVVRGKARKKAFRIVETA